MTLGAGLVATALFTSACNGTETSGPRIADGGSGTSAGGITSSGPLTGAPGTSAGGTGGGGTGGAAPDPMQTCNADAVQWAIGQPATQQMVERLRQESGATAVRVLKPGLAVTQEFRYGRLNVNVDGANVITSVSCW